MIQTQMFPKAHIAQAYVLNHLWVDVRFLEDLFQECVDNEIKRRVFESTFDRLGERCPYSKRDDYIIRVLLSSVVQECQ